MLVDKRFLFRMRMARVVAKSADRAERLAVLPPLERAIVAGIVEAIDRKLKS